MKFYKSIPTAELKTHQPMSRNIEPSSMLDVPKLVDNFLEALRPPEMPSFRHSMALHTSPEKALYQTAASHLYTICEVEFDGPVKVAYWPGRNPMAHSLWDDMVSAVRKVAGHRHEDKETFVAVSSTLAELNSNLVPGERIHELAAASPHIAAALQYAKEKLTVWQAGASEMHGGSNVTAFVEPLVGTTYRYIPVHAPERVAKPAAQRRFGPR